MRLRSNTSLTTRTNCVRDLCNDLFLHSYFFDSPCFSFPCRHFLAHFLLTARHGRGCEVTEGCLRVTATALGGVWVVGRRLGDRHVFIIVEGCATLNEMMMQVRLKNRFDKMNIQHVNKVFSSWWQMRLTSLFRCYHRLQLLRMVCWVR